MCFTGPHQDEPNTPLATFWLFHDPQSEVCIGHPIKSLFQRACKDYLIAIRGYFFGCDLRIGVASDAVEVVALFFLYLLGEFRGEQSPSGILLVGCGGFEKIRWA